MCLICVDLTKERLTSREARRNLRETHSTLTKKHILEVLRLIWEKEDAESKDIENFFKEIDYEYAKTICF